MIDRRNIQRKKSTRHLLHLFLSCCVNYWKAVNYPNESLKVYFVFNVATAECGFFLSISIWSPVERIHDGEKTAESKISAFSLDLCESIWKF